MERGPGDDQPIRKASGVNEPAAIRVGLAVVADGDRYLVGIRGPGGPLPGKAEFPGGKCHPGEQSRECAVRECREETGLAVRPIEQLLTVRHQYDHGLVELDFWACRLADDASPAAVQNGFRWVPRAELATMAFPEANSRVLDMLLGDVR